jgi:hypothetical protein
VTANISDLVSAAVFMSENYAALTILIGHSLRGAAARRQSRRNRAGDPGDVVFVPAILARAQVGKLGAFDPQNPSGKVLRGSRESPE